MSRVSKTGRPTAKQHPREDEKKRGRQEQTPRPRSQQNHTTRIRDRR